MFGSCRADNIAGTPFDFGENPGDVDADQPQAEHDAAADQQLQQDHGGETGGSIAAKPVDQGLDSQDRWIRPAAIRPMTGDELQRHRREAGDRIDAQAGQLEERPFAAAGLASRDFKGEGRPLETQPGRKPAEKSIMFTKPAPFDRQPGGRAA